MSYIKLWKAFRKGELRGFHEILGDRALMLAALFSVALHASLFLFLGDWPHLADPPRRVSAVMVARLLKPPVATSVAVPQEITGAEVGMDTGEERSALSRPAPDFTRREKRPVRVSAGGAVLLASVTSISRVVREDSLRASTCLAWRSHR